MADNLPPSSADVTESGSLNLPEPSGPHRPVMETLPLLYLLPEQHQYGDTANLSLQFIFFPQLYNKNGSTILKNHAPVSLNSDLAVAKKYYYKCIRSAITLGIMAYYVWLRCSGGPFHRGRKC
jgi:hypothetical protein